MSTFVNILNHKIWMIINFLELTHQLYLFATDWDNKKHLKFILLHAFQNQQCFPSDLALTEEQI